MTAKEKGNNQPALGEGQRDNKGAVGEMIATINKGAGDEMVGDENAVIGF